MKITSSLAQRFERKDTLVISDASILNNGAFHYAKRYVQMELLICCDQMECARSRSSTRLSRFQTERIQRAFPTFDRARATREAVSQFEARQVVSQVKEAERATAQ